MKARVIIILGAAVIVLASIGYGALTYYDNAFPFGRMWETPQIRPHEEPILDMPKGIVPFSGGEMIWRNAPPESLISPITAQTPEITLQGKTAYFTYCAQCHGKYHNGNGTVGQSFAPLPSDLRSKKVQTMLDGRLFQEISYGIPGGRQPALATTIAASERWRIIAYIKSLGIRKSP